MTETMLRQMLAYAEHCEVDGWYYGNEKQFRERHKKIMDWLKRELEDTGG